MHRRKFIGAMATGTGVFLLAPASCTVNGKYYSFNDIFGGGSDDSADGMPTVSIVGDDDLVFAADGSALCIDAGAHRLQRRDARGEPGKTWGGLGDGPGELNHPVSAVFGPDERTYVLDKGNGRVQVFAADGRHLGGSEGRHSLQHPYDLSLGADGNLYVSDTLVHKVLVLAPDGRILRSIGSGMGNEPEELNGPRGLAFSSSGELHVVDAGNARIAVFAADGKHLRSYGKYGSAPGELVQPGSMVIDRHDRVCVADTTTCFINVFRTDGTFVGRFHPVDERKQPVVPARLRLAPDGGLLVATGGHSARPDLDAAAQ